MTSTYAYRVFPHKNDLSVDPALDLGGYFATIQEVGQALADWGAKGWLIPDIAVLFET